MNSTKKLPPNPSIRQHYLLEKSLAQQIRASSRQDRVRLTMQAYDELFSKIPQHPGLSCSTKAKQDSLNQKWLLFGRLLGPRSDVLEIGAGTGEWIRAMARKTSGRCVGIDISKEVLAQKADDPSNLELRVMDATELDFPANTFDLVVSDQLIEHLHPDDVALHIADVYSALRENGVYAFRTPSRLLGPHDVSKYFDDVSTCFHLKEWTYGELEEALRKAGFREIRTMIVPYGLAQRSSLARSLGTVRSSLLVPGERIAEKIKNKRVRTVVCKCFRIAVVNLIAVK